ncbi:hypothetical protein CBF23_011740 [Marinomonas agarivorans]|nr:hypothetical protein CBF23_011740 [Marinomonas agarivorans]
MLDVIAFGFLAGLVAFTAGVYTKTTGMSFGLVLLVGLYSLKPLLPLFLQSIALPVFIATSLAVCFILNVFSLIRFTLEARNSQETTLLVGNGITTQIAKAPISVIAAMITAQLLGIVTEELITLVFLFCLSCYLLLLIWSKRLNNNYLSSSNRKKGMYLLASIFGVWTGNEGKELIQLAEGNRLQPDNSIVVATLISFAACCSFMLPALPEKLALLSDNLGYIYLPGVVYLSVIGLLAIWLVRHHHNVLDFLWLRWIFFAFLSAILLREAYSYLL